MTPQDDTPDPLLEDLRALFEHSDRVPPLVIEAGKASLGWRRLDADLAELLSDSALAEEGEFALSRGHADVRSIGFVAGPLTIDVEIHGEGAERRLLGQLSPPGQATVELQTQDREAAAATTDADALGRFRLPLPDAAAIRLRIRTGSDDSSEWLETSWLPI
jgi:hypothetical protein